MTAGDVGVLLRLRLQPLFVYAAMAAALVLAALCGVRRLEKPDDGLDLLVGSASAGRSRP